MIKCRQSVCVCAWHIKNIFSVVTFTSHWFCRHFLTMSINAIQRVQFEASWEMTLTSIINVCLKCLTQYNSLWNLNGNPCCCCCYYFCRCCFVWFNSTYNAVSSSSSWTITRQMLFIQHIFMRIYALRLALNNLWQTKKTLHKCVRFRFCIHIKKHLCVCVWHMLAAHTWNITVYLSNSFRKTLFLFCHRISTNNLLIQYQLLCRNVWNVNSSLIIVFLGYG